MGENLVLESFHAAGGEKVGVLVRRREPTSLTTLACFVGPDGLYHTENRVELDSGDPFDWRHVVQHGEGDEYLERDHLADDPAGTLPSFAEFLLVDPFWSTDEDALDFVRLDEPSGRLTPSRLVREGDEVVVEVDGTPANRYRFAEGRLVGSDWGGATSVVVDDTGALMSGLDERVTSHLLAFLGE